MIEGKIKNIKKERVLERARKLRFGPTAIGILSACAAAPQNPYNYFGRMYRNIWSYGYFARLHKHGLIKQIDPPMGCRGHHWYVLGEVGHGVSNAKSDLQNSEIGS